MKDCDKNKAQLIKELAEARQRIEMLEAGSVTQAEQALRESEERYRTLVEAADDVILLTDLEGRHLFRNSAYHRSLGFEPDEDIDLDGYARVHPDDLPMLQGKASEFLTRGTMTTEYRVQHKDGRWLYRFAKSVVITDAQQPKAFLSIIRDVTKRKQVEQALQTYSDQLEEMVEARTRALVETQEQLIRQEKLAVLGQLAGSIGHELRNPLGVITNSIYYLDLILSDADGKVKDYLNLINDRLREVDKIISGLLNLTRSRPTTRQACLIPHVVDEIISKHRPPEGITVKTQFTADLPPVYVDSQQLGQVLTNLVTNGYQAMAPGGVLTLSARSETEWVELSVIDTGPGIAPEMIDKIFEPLFTTKSKGIGLGLAITKNLLDVNGGQIEVTSEEGIGTTFVVTLPTEDGIESEDGPADPTR